MQKTVTTTNNKKCNRKKAGPKKEKKKKQQQQQQQKQKQTVGLAKPRVKKAKEAIGELRDIGAFDFLDELQEVTPTPEDYADERTKAFMKLLRPTEARYVVPTPMRFSHALCSPLNVVDFLALHDTEDFYEPVFGFILYVDMAKGFFRANGHIWVCNKRTGDWFDPTPSSDPMDERLLLLRSEVYLTPRERELVLEHPTAFSLGAIISHDLFPKNVVLGRSIEQNLGLMYHHINKRAEELSLQLMQDVRSLSDLGLAILTQTDHREDSHEPSTPPPSPSASLFDPWSPACFDLSSVAPMDSDWVGGFHEDPRVADLCRCCAAVEEGDKPAIEWAGKGLVHNGPPSDFYENKMI